MYKKKHVPYRTCIICRQKLPKSTMQRFVCGQEEQGYSLLQDTSQTKPGRGFYVCSEECQAKLSRSRAWQKKCRGK
ncbi:MAG: DUF448 domain-containing protein [Desulfohalobiaceae bacterium]